MKINFILLFIFFYSCHSSDWIVIDFKNKFNDVQDSIIYCNNFLDQNPFYNFNNIDIDLENKICINGKVASTYINDKLEIDSNSYDALKFTKNEIDRFCKVLFFLKTNDINGIQLNQEINNKLVFEYKGSESMEFDERKNIVIINDNHLFDFENNARYKVLDEKENLLLFRYVK